MKNQQITTAIVLSRTDYQEADRIITFLTHDFGKVRVMAKGVRRPRSKLAGGIELFSVSHITFVTGRRELATLISSRLETHFGAIVRTIERTMFGYELLKQFNRITEDAAGPEYFELLVRALTGLDDAELPLPVLELWIIVQLLRVTGHGPNVRTDAGGQALSAEKLYVFSFEDMAFVAHTAGQTGANHIKLLRLALGADNPVKLKQVQAMDDVLPAMLQLVRTMRQTVLHV